MVGSQFPGDGSSVLLVLRKLVYGQSVVHASVDGADLTSIYNVARCSYSNSTVQYSLLPLCIYRSTWVGVSGRGKSIEKLNDHCHNAQCARAKFTVKKQNIIHSNTALE